MAINWETDRSKAVVGETYIVTYEDYYGNRKVFWADDFDGEYFEWEEENDACNPDGYFNVIAFATLDEIDINEMVSDKTPTRWDYYIVLIKELCCNDEFSAEYSVNIDAYDPISNCWEVFDGTWGERVIAWCEWPEPYEGGY